MMIKCGYKEKQLLNYFLELLGRRRAERPSEGQEMCVAVSHGNVHLRYLLSC